MPHFTSAELKRMGLRWVTAHPNGPGTEGTPILVRDLGDEMQVVGGAGGKLNFTRFRKRGAGEEAPKPKKPKKPEPELSPEDAAKLEEQKAEGRAKAKEIKQGRRAYIESLLGQSGEATPEEIARIEKQARKNAKRLGVSEEGTLEFVQKAKRAFEQDKQESVDKAAEAIERQALQMQAEAALGVADPEGADVESKVGEQVVRTHLDPEDARYLARSVWEQRQVEAELRAVTKALRSGDAEAIRAVEMTYEAIDDARVQELALQEHIDRTEVELNNALSEAVADPTKRMSKDLHAGAADAAAALASEIAGTCILSNESANELGVAGTSRVIAEYLAEKLGDRDAAATALREYIGLHSSAVAATAVKSAERLRGLAQDMRDFGGSGEGSLCSQVQANAKALEYMNEAQRLLSRAMGGLETAAQVALNLERGQQGPLIVPGRSSEAGTRDKAAALGLSRGEYAVKRREGGGWDLIVDEKAFSKLYQERTLEQYSQDQELADIRRRQKGEGWPDWTPQGQSESILLSPHQQADIKFWERQKNVLITDEAGSGKTATILCGIAHLHKQGKVKKAVVVVPKAVALQFGEEIAKFLGPEYQDQFVVASGKSKAQRLAAYRSDKLFTIITHDTLRIDGNDIQEAAPDALAVDEAHYFSVRGEGGGSQRSQAAREINAPYKLLATGTAIKNSIDELYSLVDWMQPGVLGSKKEFTERYGALATATGMFDASLLKGLSDRLAGVMMGVKLSVQKNDEGGVHFELAPTKGGAAPIQMREHTEFLPLTATQQTQYKQEENAYLEYRDTQKAAGFKRDGALERVVNNVETTDHPKVQRLRKIFEAHPEEKAVVFATNAYAWDTIIRGLGLKAGEYELLTGSDSDKERQRKQRVLNDPDSGVRYLIASDAANFGLNLQGASVLVNFDTTDTSATHEQRIAREFRRGQKRNVSVYNLRTKTPLEIKAQHRIERKAKVAGLPHALQHADESGLAPLLEAALKDRTGKGEEKLSKAWDESKHPRETRGRREGGRFAASVAAKSPTWTRWGSLQPWQMTAAAFRAHPATKTLLAPLGTSIYSGLGRPSRAAMRASYTRTADDYHRLEVRDAIRSGRAVPPEVLADYPEFRDKQ